MINFLSSIFQTSLDQNFLLHEPSIGNTQHVQETNAFCNYFTWNETVKADASWKRWCHTVSSGGSRGNRMNCTPRSGIRIKAARTAFLINTHNVESICTEIHLYSRHVYSIPCRL